MIKRPPAWWSLSHSDAVQRAGGHAGQGWDDRCDGKARRRYRVFLPDLQYHFHDMDPNWVVNHAYNVASYLLEHDNPMKDGETIDGVADGQMCREIQWKCQYEDALIQPPRGVLDILWEHLLLGGGKL